MKFDTCMACILAYFMVAPYLGAARPRARRAVVVNKINTDVGVVCVARNIDNTFTVTHLYGKIWNGIIMTNLTFI